MTSFADLGVPAAVARSLHARRIEEPFPIQVDAIPPALKGRDVCGKAPTGSGKTIAFGIPMVTRCPAAAPGQPTGLVLVPTRELAEQVASELALLAAPIGLQVDRFYGGVSIERQISALRRGVDIAVACPGRLRDLIDRGEVRLDAAELVVVDEADRMADMGFLPEVRAILDDTPTDRQTLLFSATLDGDVDVLIKHYQRNPARVEVRQSRHDQAADAVHYFWNVSHDRKFDDVADIVKRLSSAVVFCRTRHGADRVAEQLAKRGVTSVALHGDKSQNQRERALARFRNGSVRALVATDVAARGIHIDGVAGVVQFDLPADHKDYTHRAGRTARAGATGVVITFITPEKHKIAAQLQRDLKMPVAADEVTLSRLGHEIPIADGRRAGVAGPGDQTPAGRTGSKRPKRPTAAPVTPSSPYNAARRKRR